MTDAELNRENAEFVIRWGIRWERPIAISRDVALIFVGYIEYKSDALVHIATNERKIIPTPLDRSLIIETLNLLRASFDIYHLIGGLKSL